jgi:protease II
VQVILFEQFVQFVIFVFNNTSGAFSAASALLSNAHLFVGAVLEVPFLNAFEEMQSPSNSISKFEINEWGDLAALRSVDPMEIASSRRVTVPPVLLSCSDADSRVSAKSVERFASLMRGHGNRVELLKVEGGHAGDGGHHSWTKDAAKILHFILSTVKH